MLVRSPGYSVRLAGNPLQCARSGAGIGEATLNTSSLLWTVLFSSIGLGFFIYGKRQRAVVPLVCGLVLMVYPYLVSSTALLVGIGIALVAVPYFVRI